MANVYTLWMRPTSGGLHRLLISTQQILVCFLLLPNSCARDQSMIWNAACLGFVSAKAQMWQFYQGQHIYGQCMYTENEANLWRTEQHAAFDAANCSLISATSQPLCYRSVDHLERWVPLPWLCWSSNVTILPRIAYIWPMYIYCEWGQPLADCTACCFRCSKF